MARADRWRFFADAKGLAVGQRHNTNGNLSEQARSRFAAADLLKVLNSEFDTVLASGQGKLTGKIVRIGHMGIVDKADIDAAVAAAKGCPIFETGGSIEVAEAVDM